MAKRGFKVIIAAPLCVYDALMEPEVRAEKPNNRNRLKEDADITSFNNVLQRVSKSLLADPLQGRFTGQVVPFCSLSSDMGTVLINRASTAVIRLVPPPVAENMQTLYLT